MVSNDKHGVALTVDPDPRVEVRDVNDLPIRVNQPIYILDMAGARDDFLRQRKTGDGCWPEIERELHAFRSRESVSSWFGIGSRVHDAGNVIRIHRRVVAMLRLLVAALHHARVVAADPFGDGHAPLRHRRETGRLVLWSVGQNGVDDGGCVPEDAGGYVWKVGGKKSRDIILVIPDK